MYIYTFLNHSIFPQLGCESLKDRKQGLTISAFPVPGTAASSTCVCCLRVFKPALHTKGAF